MPQYKDDEMLRSGIKIPSPRAKERDFASIFIFLGAQKAQ
jgi:hypothetical protein